MHNLPHLDIVKCPIFFLSFKPCMPHEDTDCNLSTDALIASVVLYRVYYKDIF